MGDTTPLTLPADLPYPITVTRVAAAAGSKVRRGDRMLEYSFLSATRRKDIAAADKAGKTLPESQRSNDMVGSWESPIDGEVVKWVNGIKAGETIEQRHAAKAVVQIEQPCSHPVQFNGMCGVCGADITNDDYMSRPAENEAGPSRYPGSFELAHDASGVTVSTNEAKRLETLSRDALLASKRLSLIVDLDQTIIHTTVDPTVGEWMAECEADEKAATTSSDTKEEGNDGQTTTPPTTPPGSPKAVKERNPNAEALKDVARFQLADDLPPSWAKGKGRPPEPVRWYYTKPRPGLTRFLAEMSKLYEMHVYTMGTRSYADAICNIVDPDGNVFGGRILSRDESGSMSSKSLVRLFPTDQSMVVVIDDRSDVWGDCPNLVKVVPYDFFVGIGDINSAFLPPTQPTITPVPGQPSSASSSAASTPPPETPRDIPSTEDGLLLKSKLLDEMAESRPLAKLDLENNEEEDEAGGGDTPTENKVPAPEASSTTEASSSASAEAKPQSPHKHHRRAVLNPVDHELDRVGNILREIHMDYYDAYASRDPSSSRLPLQCDTPLLIGEIKDKVLSGCTIAFTGVIPRNVEPERSEIWQLAESFGAVCVHDLSDKITHLVTASLGTEKMYKASKMRGVKVVWLAWLQTSIALWKHEDETNFLAHPVAQGAAPSQPDSPSPEKEKEGEEKDDTGLSEDELMQDAAAFDAAWSDDAQAELDAFLQGGDSDSGSDTEKEDRGDGDGGDGEGDGDDDMDDNEKYHRWSRASTPGPSILSRPPSPGSSAPSKHVRYADEENQPLERVREPKPGEIVSFPPRKKRKVLLLTPPTGADDVPEENKFTYQPKPAWKGGMSMANGEESDAGTDGEDEFARMLSDSLADEQ